ncbi:MAG: hypothetical protein ACREUU_15650, partial [Gammaproteobacteria bacterium]
ERLIVKSLQSRRGRDMLERRLFMLDMIRWTRWWVLVLMAAGCSALPAQAQFDQPSPPYLRDVLLPVASHLVRQRPLTAAELVLELPAPPESLRV